MFTARPLYKHNSRQFEGKLFRAKNLNDGPKLIVAYLFGSIAADSLDNNIDRQRREKIQNPVEAISLSSLYEYFLIPWH